MPVNLIVNSRDAEYLEPYEKQSDRFRIFRLSPEEDSHLQGFVGMQRAAYNYARCLSANHANPEAELLVVIEDDVRFAKGWSRRLREATQEVTSAFGLDWVLSLYSPLTDESSVRAAEGKKWFPRSWEGFFGTQGIVYPRPIAAAFISEIQRCCVEPFEVAYDLALSAFLRERKIPILSTAPCLIQHMGDVSQGVCDRFHQSLGFMEEVPN